MISHFVTSRLDIQHGVSFPPNQAISVPKGKILEMMPYCSLDWKLGSACDWDIGSRYWWEIFGLKHWKILVFLSSLHGEETTYFAQSTVLCTQGWI